MLAFSDENVPQTNLFIPKYHLLQQSNTLLAGLPSSQLLWLSLSCYSVPSPWSWCLVSFCYFLILCFSFLISSSLHWSLSLHHATLSASHATSRHLRSVHMQSEVEQTPQGLLLLIFSLYYCTKSPFLSPPTSFSLPSPTLGVLLTLPTSFSWVPEYSSAPSFWSCIFYLGFRQP